MQIVPTLNFGGNCREAIQMYEKAFNGKVSCMTTYEEVWNSLGNYDRANRAMNSNLSDSCRK